MLFRFAENMEDSKYKNRPVFISFAHKDIPFVRLLAALLKYYNINYWYSEQIPIGTKFPDTIARNLRIANTLIVVISKKTCNSIWVKKEIGEFKGAKPEGLIIPLILEETNVNNIFPQLSDYQQVDFTNCMLKGFETIFKLFEIQFLLKLDKRKQDRRIQKSIERRSSAIVERLQYDLYKPFKESNENSYIQVSEKNRIDIVDTIVPNTNSYKFLTINNNEEKPNYEVIDEISESIYKELRKREKPVKLSTIVALIAEETGNNYKIIANERRTKYRRTNAS